MSDEPKSGSGTGGAGSKPKRPRGRPKGSGAKPAAGAGSAGDTPIIKKYANRRLYDTGASRYVTLEDLAMMVREGHEFVVQDARTGEDITRPVLGQIIFEQEAKEGQSLLPTEFLRQIISYYGDQMGAVVPSYLEQSMTAFQRSQDEMREQLSEMMGGKMPDASKLGQGMAEMAATPLKMIEEQTRRNAEIFSNAMRMFSPFGAPGGAAPGSDGTPGDAAPQPAEEPEAGKGDELHELRAQIAAMQRKVDRLGD